MGRCCAVKNCSSGRKKSKSILKLNISFFKVPKKPDLAKRWSAAIGQELTLKHYVCQLHFNTTDIIAQDNIKLTNGEIYSSDRSRIRLKPDAIPQLNVNQSSKNTDSVNVNIRDNIKLLTGKIYSSHKSKVAIEEANPQLNSNHCLNNTGFEIVYIQENIKLLDEDNYLSNRSKATVKLEPISQSNLIQCSNNTDYENVNNGVNGIKSPTYNNQTSNIPFNNSILNNKVVTSTSESCSTQCLSLHDIYAALEVKPLPQNWSWSFNHENSIILSYLDSTCWKLKCHLKITYDLTVTIINAYTELCIDVHEAILDIDTVWNLLTKVQKYYFCSGTGFNEEKCSSTCEGMALYYGYKRKMPIYRCGVCRKLRQNIRNKKNNKVLRRLNKKKNTQ